MASPADLVTSVQNIDIAGLGDRIVEISSNLLQDPSARTAETTIHTIGRLKAWMNRLDRYVVAIALPVDPLDYTAADPQAVSVLVFPADKIDGVENRELKDILRRLLKLYQELLGCQSKDRTSGLNLADLKRYGDMVGNIRSMIEFIESEPAADIPETG